MLTNLSIKNYALIDDLNVAFSSGFTTITGETGAGKSILLGALSLVLGKRADLSSLNNKEQKCIIEAEFSIEKYHLISFFKTHELEYEAHTILRREILPSGKSRAFINDSPVALAILNELGQSLVDIHSQHQTLLLTENDFQLRVIDAMASNQERLVNFRIQLKEYIQLSKELELLFSSKEEKTKELDYNSFLLKELEEANLRIGMQAELESEYEQLNNVETIRELLGQAYGLVQQEQFGIVDNLLHLNQVSQKLSGFGERYQQLLERITSIKIEFDDIAADLEDFQSDIEANPKRLEEVNDKLQKIYALQKKHQVASDEELISIQEDLTKSVFDSENIDKQIAGKQQILRELEQQLNSKAIAIRGQRNKVVPILKQRLEEKLSLLGMNSATFKIEVNPANSFKQSGKDTLLFLFSANKGSSFNELKKVASGGELSRIMLVIKSLISNYEQLPTIMFDEIDTGVSGEVSNKMGSIMAQMGEHMQVFSITHLPQVASMGSSQFKVFKEEKNQITTTSMKRLNQEERTLELAEMLGGKIITASALAHAKDLLVKNS